MLLVSLKFGISLKSVLLSNSAVKSLWFTFYNLLSKLKLIVEIVFTWSLELNPILCINIYLIATST